MVKTNHRVNNANLTIQCMPHNIRIVVVGLLHIEMRIVVLYFNLGIKTHSKLKEIRVYTKLIINLTTDSETGSMN